MSKPIPNNRSPPPQQQQQRLNERFSSERVTSLLSQMGAHVAGEELLPRKRLVEVLEELAVVASWSDRNDQRLFQRMLELGLMDVIQDLVVLETTPTYGRVAALRCISTILTNLRNAESLRGVCADDRVNIIISINADARSDETLLSVYVSFLRTLASRLTPELLELFYDPVTNAFPLLTKATEMLRVKDLITRAAARQTIVTATAVVAPLQAGDYLPLVLADVFEVTVQTLHGDVVELMAELPWCDRPYDAALAPITRARLQNLRDAREDAVDDALYLGELADVPGMHCVADWLRELIHAMGASVLQQQREGVVGPTCPAGDLSEMPKSGPRQDTAVVFSNVPAEVTLSILVRWCDKEGPNSVARRCLLDYIGGGAAAATGDASQWNSARCTTPAVETSPAKVDDDEVEESGTALPTPPPSPAVPVLGFAARLLSDRTRVDLHWGAAALNSMYWCHGAASPDFPSSAPADGTDDSSELAEFHDIGDVARAYGPHHAVLPVVSSLEAHLTSPECCRLLVLPILLAGLRRLPPCELARVSRFLVGASREAVRRMGRVYADAALGRCPAGSELGAQWSIYDLAEGDEAVAVALRVAYLAKRVADTAKELSSSSAEAATAAVPAVPALLPWKRLAPSQDAPRGAVDTVWRYIASANVMEASAYARLLTDTAAVVPLASRCAADADERDVVLLAAYAHTLQCLCTPPDDAPTLPDFSSCSASAAASAPAPPLGDAAVRGKPTAVPLDAGALAVVICVTAATASPRRMLLLSVGDELLLVSRPKNMRALLGLEDRGGDGPTVHQLAVARRMPAVYVCCRPSLSDPCRLSLFVAPPSREAPMQEVALSLPGEEERDAAVSDIAAYVRVQRHALARLWQPFLPC